MLAIIRATTAQNIKIRPPAASSWMNCSKGVEILLKTFSRGAWFFSLYLELLSSFMVGLSGAKLICSLPIWGRMSLIQEGNVFILVTY